MQPLANALLTTLAILILNANQNVWSTQNAPETRLASIRNAKIPVLGFAVHLLTAQQRTTTLFASVSLVTLEMLLLHVRGSQHVSWVFNQAASVVIDSFRTTKGVNTKTRPLQPFPLWVKCTLF